jgi:hypothetical protein
MVEHVVSLIPQKISPKIKQYKSEVRLILVKKNSINNSSFGKHLVKIGFGKKKFSITIYLQQMC